MRPRPLDIFQDLGGGSFGISHGGLGFDRRRLGLLFFAKRTLALKETPDSTKDLNKNENYHDMLKNAILSIIKKCHPPSNKIPRF